ncbi:MAG: bifunctional demethylmenaquinone methyltransferase/2-methoxy-6-polyprenyl-1,4-benzoquinol methylase UbiE [Nitrospinota bacterium]|nr:bifunctional demethylmenaquinone methyltransferase/2-methoxy-6-polyprenyl-1,4-benzoquinol methylase UbiE [Nitrospinota bacterium]MDH5679312.1 bifunctional demethylmenaquinone methyltransferase/2-methoxy-6-polyprenyl-1,4-benzoquinol methylase UbiE [Nitrospinota bacterium]MDH5757719.1 bifunctional demethylmenaquinone methyltransferase/2-methoxy-6-polyprenyl-1,4-benzoquinol methylase UbiE [Nitrospinota bacterium]
MNNTDQKAEAVERMFSSIAPRYDLLNHFLSLGFDIRWRKRAVGAFPGGVAGKNILDVACGTGDLALALARAGDDATRVTGGDFSSNMLAIGGEKVAKAGLGARLTLEFLDALKIEHPDGAFDGVTCAFGVRNFADLDRGLLEMARILKPGGRMVILEFTTPTNRVIAAAYRLYFTRILPFIGGLISGNRGAYEYLPDTVYKFPTPDQLSARIAKLGLAEVGFTPLTFGICGIHTAIKPKNEG